MKLEKINFKSSRGLNLVGELHIPENKTGSIVIISHGFAARKDRERLIKMADALSNKSISTLRFDFSGCGESDEDFISVSREIDDLKSAIKFVRDKGYKDIGLLGESLGGLVTLNAYDEEIKSVVLWAPVTDKRRPEIEEGIIESNEDVSKGDNDFVVHKKEGRDFRIKKEYFEERASVDKEKLLSKIKCPILVIHGDADDTIPLEWSKYAVENLPKGSKLEIIKDGSHALNDKMGEVIPLTSNWFKEHLK